MIIAKLANADRYAALHPRFAAAFEFIRNFDFAAAAAGPAEVDGERLTINVLRTEGRPVERVKFEAHRRYVDIQFLYSGAEHFAWKLTSECTQPVGEFDAAKDVIKYDDAPEDWFALPPGSFALFFPEDAHAPLRGEGPINKLVVKVLLD